MKHFFFASTFTHVQINTTCGSLFCWNRHLYNMDCDSWDESPFSRYLLTSIDVRLPRKGSITHCCPISFCGQQLYHRSHNNIGYYLCISSFLRHLSRKELLYSNQSHVLRTNCLALQSFFSS